MKSESCHHTGLREGEREREAGYLVSANTHQSVSGLKQQPQQQQERRGEELLP